MKKYILPILLILFLTGCANSQNRVQEIFQTDNATQIKHDYLNITSLLLEFKKKLDIRNPNNYEKRMSHYINKDIKNSTNEIYLKYKDKYIKSYMDYLKTAFSTKPVKNRNDYLIIGLYKLIYEAYEIDKNHRFTTLNYNKDKLKELYYSLMVINWEIKTKRDQEGDYLFLTWQNNWQIELDKRLRKKEQLSIKLINDLAYIKNKKETLLSKSNCNFEILISKMLYHIKNSLKIIGDEPLDISIDTAKSLIFFL
jgi:hypothetical protein